TYGILLLNQLDPSIEAMGASYRIEVPRQALRAANRGIMNVLYASATSATTSQYAWLLWLADHPLK
ncbi:MAG TPA: hypothetical protein VGL73_04915, partial [Caulobacteraceae bacterium]